MEVCEVKSRMKRAYIIVLNFNGWQDTLECLESLMKLDDVQYRIVIVDNASSNNSVEKICAWAAGRLSATCQSKTPEIRQLVLPYMEGAKDFCIADGTIQNHLITLLINHENRGFAAGMNAGIKYALRHADCEYLWILNNDTVVRPESLKAAIARFDRAKESEKHAKNQRKLGIVSMYGYCYDNIETPNKRPISCGWNHWRGRVKELTDEEVKKENYRSYYGASFVISRECIEYVGLMDERHFLYMEEEDWAERLRRNDFYISFAMDAVIYHKEGRSVQRSQNPKDRWGDLIFRRSMILFTKQFFPWCLPMIYINLANQCLRAMIHRRFWWVHEMVKIMLHPEYLPKRGKTS